MFGVNVKLAAIALILTPISSYTFWTIGRRVNRQFEQLQAQFGDLSAKAQALFKAGRKEEALTVAEQAIQQGKTDKVDTSAFEKRVAALKAGKM